MDVEGFAGDGYDEVRKVFQRLVDDGLETGAGLSVRREGREVVRLNAGWADAGRSRPWRSDTLVQPYSLSKAVVTLAALVAVRDGRLALDEPIARYWGAYGVRGKERTTCDRYLRTGRASRVSRPKPRGSTCWTTAGCGRAWRRRLRSTFPGRRSENTP